MQAIIGRLAGWRRLATRKSAIAVLASSLIAGGVLTACQNAPPPRPRYADITFSQYPPINLDVAQIEVVNDYTPPLRPPNVEHLFPVSIAATAERWGHERLRAVGSFGTARVIIRDASAVATNLPRTRGVTGMFTNDQAVRYDGQVEMAVEILDSRGLRQAVVEAGAKRSRTAPEDISLNDRDHMFYEMTEDLMRDINGSLEKNMRSFMAKYIR